MDGFSWKSGSLLVKAGPIDWYHIRQDLSHWTPPLILHLKISCKEVQKRYFSIKTVKLFHPLLNFFLKRFVSKCSLLSIRAHTFFMRAGEKKCIVLDSFEAHSKEHTKFFQQTAFYKNIFVCECWAYAYNLLSMCEWSIWFICVLYAYTEHTHTSCKCMLTLKKKISIHRSAGLGCVT